jgi:hypothetical protein
MRRKRCGRTFLAADVSRPLVSAMTVRQRISSDLYRKKRADDRIRQRASCATRTTGCLPTLHGDPLQVKARVQHLDDGLNVPHLLGYALGLLIVLKDLAAQFGVESFQGPNCGASHVLSSSFRRRANSFK